MTLTTLIYATGFHNILFNEYLPQY